MSRIRTFVKHNTPLILAKITFVATLLVNKNVAIYGDDYRYCTFVTGGLRSFVGNHVDHYMQVNGRAIVHVLVTVFLALPKSMWRVFNSLLLGSFVYFGSRIVIKDNDALLQNIACPTLLCSGILALDIHVTRQSVYWLTGALNYVYPVGLLMLYWYLLEHNGNKIITAIASFLSAATTEQNAMMTVGLSFLYLAYNFRQWKDKKSLAVNFGLSIAGMCTVLLAPSVLVRYGLENKTTPFMNLLRSNVKSQWVRFFAARYVVFYQVVFIAVSCLFMLSYRSMLNRKERAFAYVLSVYAIAETALIIMLSRQESNVMTPDRLLKISVISVYYVVLSSFNVYVLFRHRPVENYYIPLFALILYIGSQVMMIVSPVWGARNELCGIFMLSLCSSFYAAHINLSEGAGLMKAGLILICIVVSAASLSNVSKTIAGYAENIQVEHANIALIGQYKENGGVGELYQYKLIDESYGWSMPYYSRYHEVYYKVRYGLPKELNIRWVDYAR